MKSILVDALRQANGKEPDSTLSDSGSFDATQPEFGQTANDAEVVPLENPDENLELLQTAAFHTEDFDAEPDSEFPEQSLAVTRAIDSAAIIPKRGSSRAPVLARFAPLVCVALAIVSAGSWALYQQYGTANHNHRLGAADMPVNPGIANNAGESTASAAERFPFIDPGIENDSGATPE